MIYYKLKHLYNYKQKQGRKRLSSERESNRERETQNGATNNYTKGLHENITRKGYLNIICIHWCRFKRPYVLRHLTKLLLMSFCP